MDFDVYLRCVGGGHTLGGPPRFPFRLIEEALGSYVEEQEEYCLSLLYPDGGRCALYAQTRKVEVDGFMVARHPSIPSFGGAFSTFCGRRQAF